MVTDLLETLNKFLRYYLDISQRKMMQQRTSVVLNQMVKKAPQNIVCNKPQIHGLNIAKQVYPINSVLLAVPQNQYGETNFIQASAGNQSKNISIQPTGKLAFE